MKPTTPTLILSDVRSTQSKPYLSLQLVRPIVGQGGGTEAREGGGAGGGRGRGTGLQVTQLPLLLSHLHNRKYVEVQIEHLEENLEIMSGPLVPGVSTLLLLYLPHNTKVAFLSGQKLALAL